MDSTCKHGCDAQLCEICKYTVPLENRITELETHMGKDLAEIIKLNATIKSQSKIGHRNAGIIKRLVHSERSLKKQLTKAIEWIQHDCPWDEAEIREQLEKDNE